MIQIEQQNKARIAKYGAYKLFGVDFNVRQNMDEQQLIGLFDQVWSSRLEYLVLNSEVCQLEEVYRRLPKNNQNYVDPNQEHRSFSYQYADFIVQLQPNTNSQYNLTDLWLIRSADANPKALFIEFDSVDEKELFKSLATILNMKDSELGLKLIRNFMNLHPGYLAADEKNA